MIRRARKYRLFPTAAQVKSLKQSMRTCRWMYNQAVSHFQKTNEFQAEHLRDLYVTKKSKKTLVYAEGMSSLPERVFKTPKNFRFNVMRSFQTNVKSALTNKKNGNIDKFKIGFSSKKRSPSFTISEDGVSASIQQKQSAYFLSVSSLKDIRVKMKTHVNISSEIDILNVNGFWYVAIPEYVQPAPFDNRGKCIALDPGIKAFTTGVDLEGNVVEFGRDTKTHLAKFCDRQSDAQSKISKFKDRKGKTTYQQYRAYTRAKRAFASCTAKMKNCVKELHYQTSAYLTKHYDAIVLPIFQTKNMVKKAARATTGSTRAC